MSVISQNYPNLELIVMDGGSSDDSTAIIKRFEKSISYWSSEKDNGMYNAINKGFLKSTGDLMCWLNSDDILQPGSLEYIAQIFTNRPDVEWLQGWPSVINEDGEIIYRREPVYSKFHFYLFNHESTFKFIQQESTFWRRSLWLKTGGRLDTAYKVAADFDLWMKFFNQADLFCSGKSLGSFRKRAGQQSENRELYLLEARRSVESNFRNLSFSEKVKLKLALSLKTLSTKLPAGMKKRVGNLVLFIQGKPRFVEE